MRDPAIPHDTTPDAHRHQRDIYARMGGTARVAIAFELSEVVARVARAGIRHRHPEYTDEQVFHAWARLKLGDELVLAAWPHRELVDP